MMKPRGEFHIERPMWHTVMFDNELSDFSNRMRLPKTMSAWAVVAVLPSGLDGRMVGMVIVVVAVDFCAFIS
jgi:hypothetical protein